MTFEIPAAEPKPEELARECRAAAGNAVEWVRSMSGIELDFSPPSLVILDKVLEQVVRALTDDDREPVIVLFGSYLGEVLLDACGGRWETGDVFTGPGIRGLYGKEITINPFTRVRQSLKNMEQNHLAVYWNSVIDRINDSSPMEDPVGFRPPPGTPLKKLPVANGGRQIEGPSDAELGKTIPEETKQFIKILRKDLGVELDYTKESLKFLDHYLRSVNDKIPQDGSMGKERMFVYLAGNYLGEVLRREYSGKWVYNDEFQTTGLVLEKDGYEMTIFPHNAAAKMAMRYKDDSVIKYARKVARDLDKKK